MLQITFNTRSRRIAVLPVLFVACLLTSFPLLGNTLTFEGLADLQGVDHFYPGVSFSNAIAAIAGVSLNDAELPPASGITVALNDGGPMTIEWDSAVTSFEGLFTYTAPLTLKFFLSGIPIGTAVSAFGNNLALSGEPGSSPNEAILFNNHGAFDSVVIDIIGTYGVDDVTYDASAQVVPEPATAIPVAVNLLCVLCAMRRFRGLDRQKNAISARQC